MTLYMLQGYLQHVLLIASDAVHGPRANRGARAAVGDGRRARARHARVEPQQGVREARQVRRRGLTQVPQRQRRGRARVSVAQRCRAGYSRQLRRWIDRALWDMACARS